MSESKKGTGKSVKKVKNESITLAEAVSKGKETSIKKVKEG